MAEDTAVFQMEFARKRWEGMPKVCPYESNSDTLYNLASSLARDTIWHGGTLVIVADGEKVTFVQRPTAPPIDKTEEASS